MAQPSQPKLTGFIGALALTGFFMGLFITLFVGMENAYNITADDDEFNLDNYDIMGEVYNETNTLSEDVVAKGNMSFVEQFTDVTGTMFSSGFKILSMSWKSFWLYEDVFDTAFSNTTGGSGAISHGGQIASYTKDLIITMLLIIVVFGIILAALIKRPG
jgi:hypothetical protein